jgi:hypothetical protein
VRLASTAALAAAALLGLGCTSSPAEQPDAGNCDGYFNVDCSRFPNVNCGRAEGVRCPEYDYGCADGAYYYVEANDPSSCPLEAGVDTGQPDVSVFPLGDATDTGGDP